MTRRERHLRIIESWGPMSSIRDYFEGMMIAKLGMSAYTDDAIEELARMLVVSDKRRRARQRAKDGYYR